MTSKTKVKPCRNGMYARHWFAYRGMVGSSSPTCVRSGCNEPNPNYEPGADPFRSTQGADTP